VDEELKTCSCCDAEVEISKRTRGMYADMDTPRRYSYVISCCGTEYVSHDTPYEAIKAWNTRPIGGKDDIEPVKQNITYASQLIQEIDQLKQQVEKLTALVPKAYDEGFDDGKNEGVINQYNDKLDVNRGIALEGSEAKKELDEITGGDTK